MKNQKSFRSFQPLATALLALPAVTALIPTDLANKKVATEALRKGLGSAFNRWYEARASAQYGIHEGTGYPGDVAAFQLALKAGFFPYRYAFPAGELNMALEAIQANLPSVAEIDGYNDNTGPGYIRSQIQGILTFRQKVAAEGLEGACDCPACQQERQLVPVTEPGQDTAPGQESDAPNVLDGQELAGRSDDDLARFIAAEVGKMIGDRFDFSKPKPRSGFRSYREARAELLELGAELREKFVRDDIAYVRRFTSKAPSVAMLQATILRLAELGYTDVTEKWIRVILEDDPTFVLVPKPGTTEYLLFLEALTPYYPDRDIPPEYPEDRAAAFGFRLRVLEEAISEGKRLLAAEGPDGPSFKKVVQVMSSEPNAFLAILAKMNQLGEQPLMETFLAGYEKLTNDTSLRAALSPSSPEYARTQRELAANFG